LHFYSLLFIVIIVTDFRVSATVIEESAQAIGHRVGKPSLEQYADITRK